MRGLCLGNLPWAASLPILLSPFAVLTYNCSLGVSWPKEHSCLLDRQPNDAQRHQFSDQFTRGATGKWQEVVC